MTGEEYKGKYRDLLDEDKPRVRFDGKVYYIRRGWNPKHRRMTWFLCDTENRYNVLFLKNDMQLEVDDGTD